jgi:hypothetical protein
VYLEEQGVRELLIGNIVQGASRETKEIKDEYLIG